MAPSVALIHSPFMSAVVWGGAADAIRAEGFGVLVPEVLDDDEPPYASRFVARVSQQLHLAAPGERLVRVGHGGAGPLLPQIAFARQASGAPVHGYVFVDAQLPRTMRSATRLDLLEADDPVGSATLSQQLADGARVPNWTDADLVDQLPDAADRALLLASLRPRGLDFFTEALPVPEDWPDAPCAYLQLSDAYEAAAHTAELRSWAVSRRHTHHLWAMSHPDEFARSLAELIP
jgi:hypothetical protein